MAHISRILAKRDAIIQEMVSITGKPKIEIREEALEPYCYQERMRLFNEGYNKLKSDKRAWQRELKERKELEGTLEDGLEDSLS